MLQTQLSILVVDDHKLFREGLIRVIQSFTKFPTIHQASNGHEALDLLLTNSIDLILLDVQMPKLNGIETIKKLNSAGHHPPVIILTQFEDESLIIHLLQRGVNGFLLKSSTLEELEAAIVSVLEHGSYYNEMTRALLKKCIPENKEVANLEMSNRELQVMALLKEGNSNKEISKILNLTTYTVESYRKAILKKTKCRTAAEVISLVYRTGIVATSK